MAADTPHVGIAVADDADHERAERTRTLIHERRDLLRRIDDIEGADAHSRRQRERLRRQVDDVTSSLLELHKGLAMQQVNTFSALSSEEQRNEFQAAAMVGLMDAIQGYDPDIGRFSGWAYRRIFREVLNAVRQSDHSNVTRGDFERRKGILGAHRRLSEAAQMEGGAPPTDEQVAEASGCTVEAVRRVLYAPRVDSLDRPVGDGSDHLAVLVSEPEKEPSDDLRSASQLRLLAAHGIGKLTAREIAVLTRRYGLDGEPADSLTTIGALLGLSRETVRQDERRGVTKLLHPSVLAGITAEAV